MLDPNAQDPDLPAPGSEEEAAALALIASIEPAPDYTRNLQPSVEPGVDSNVQDPRMIPPRVARYLVFGNQPDPNEQDREDTQSVSEPDPHGIASAAVSEAGDMMDFMRAGPERWVDISFPDGDSAARGANDDQDLDVGPQPFIHAHRTPTPSEAGTEPWEFAYLDAVEGPPTD